MYCTHCGQEITEGSRYCTHCGKAVGSSLEAGLVPQAEGNSIQSFPVIKTTTGIQNWFELHLNWTMGIAWIILALVAILFFVLLGIQAYAYIYGYYIGYISEDQLYELIGGLVITVYVFLAVLYILLMITIVLESWYLIKKDRSLWWLLMANLVPFGFIVFICLKNRSRQPAAAVLHS